MRLENKVSFFLALSLPYFTTISTELKLYVKMNFMTHGIVTSTCSILPRFMVHKKNFNARILRAHLWHETLCTAYKIKIEKIYITFAWPLKSSNYEQRVRYKNGKNVTCLHFVATFKTKLSRIFNISNVIFQILSQFTESSTSICILALHMDEKYYMHPERFNPGWFSADNSVVMN